MKKVVTAIADKKLKETLSAVADASEEMITISRKTLSLEVLVALLGGIVIGMFLSPRKKVTYKIASNNHDIGSGECSGKGCRRDDDDKYDEDEEYDEDEDEDNEDSIPVSGELENNDKFIKL